jgi:hypothetical protein
MGDVKTKGVEIRNLSSDAHYQRLVAMHGVGAGINDKMSNEKTFNYRAPKRSRLSFSVNMHFKLIGAWLLPPEIGQTKVPFQVVRSRIWVRNDRRKHHFDCRDRAPRPGDGVRCSLTHPNSSMLRLDDRYPPLMLGYGQVPPADTYENRW